MGGLVGVIANDSARYSLFTSCVWNLETPEGWTKRMLIGGDWCGARNALAQEVLDGGHSHLWFMDDDHAFPPQMLVKLLQHDKDLVTPICLTRVPPFTPVQYTEKIGENQYLPIPLSQSATDGLVEIQAGGCAGMLISRAVIEAIKPPWFEYTDRSEDIVFCEKAKAAGFTLYADLSCRLGHITTATVWPSVDQGKWATGLTIGRDLTLNVHVEPAEVFDAQKESPREETWRWELRRVITNEVLVEVYRPSWQPVAYEYRASDSPPEGQLQWWVDEGDGVPHRVGDPFTYMVTEET
jgi:hypothetical protein